MKKFWHLWCPPLDPPLVVDFEPKASAARHPPINITCQYRPRPLSIHNILGLLITLDAACGVGWGGLWPPSGLVISMILRAGGGVPPLPLQQNDRHM